jgi:hypothetical protein
MGAATFYPFVKSDYAIKDMTNNPFIFEKGMVLFGDYQFGVHGYFSNEHPNLGQRLFSPEDCSSAVGKANNLTEKQVVGINTSALKAAYTNPTNEYGYKAITSSSLEEKLDYELIELGDTYVRGGHTAIISGKDNFGNIQTLEFNRDIDIAKDKRLGGGAYEYNLSDMPTAAVYILRGSEPPLKEACSLSDLLAQVDRNYYQFYKTTQRDIKGDCNMFFDIDTQAIRPTVSAKNYNILKYLTLGTTIFAGSYIIYNKYYNDNWGAETSFGDLSLIGDTILIQDEL